MKYPYVAIEGVIGVGKTTLVRLLRLELGAQLLLERFEENPFLSSFYADPARYAFQAQVFFLLSRYRQQHDVLPKLLAHSPVIADYILAKDQLFARYNLVSDELRTYEQLYTALSGNLPVPDLVIYLYADTPVLLRRIALRDRSYERELPPDYIEGLRLAYERFFATYGEAPLLRIDANALDPMHNADDLAQIVQRVRLALRHGTHQTSPPRMNPEDGTC